MKSHMPQSIVTGKQYQYQCPVCIFQHGHAEGRIWKGTDIFLTHVATHRGKDIPSEGIHPRLPRVPISLIGPTLHNAIHPAGKTNRIAVLHKLNIINDHVSDDKGNFDLNLFPSGVIDKDGYTNSESSSQLSRQSTHSTVVEKLRGRKPSTLDIGSGMMRTHTNVSMRDRADSVLQGMPPTPKEEDESGSMASLSNVKDQKLISITAEPWSAGLSEFHVEKEGDYLSGDF